MSRTPGNAEHGLRIEIASKPLDRVIPVQLDQGMTARSFSLATLRTLFFRVHLENEDSTDETIALSLLLPNGGHYATYRARVVERHADFAVTIAGNSIGRRRLTGKYTVLASHTRARGRAMASATFTLQRNEVQP